MCSNNPDTNCGIANEVTYDSIQAIPLKYWNGSNWVQQNVRTTSGFRDRLIEWKDSLKFFSDNFAAGWFDTLQWIGHLGTYNCKNGCHGLGRAIDIAFVQWNGYAVNIRTGAHASGDRTMRRRYLAIDAICRKYFRYTLDGWYNSDHYNHIHVDNDNAPVFSKSSESDTKFIQAVCNNFNGAGLTIDGVWGTNTQNAWSNINNAWSYNTSVCNAFSVAADTAEWCHQVARHGFDDVGAGKYLSKCYGTN
jgi:hypothetical protein